MDDYGMCGGGCGIVILSCVDLEIWKIITKYEKIQKQLTDTDNRYRMHNPNLSCLSRKIDRYNYTYHSWSGSGSAKK